MKKNWALFPASESLREIVILSAVFLIFLAILLPQISTYPYYPTDYYVLAHSHQIRSEPLAAWAPDPDDRRHPFHYYLLFLEGVLFGPDPTGYFLVLFLFHFLNSLLVSHLCGRLGGNQKVRILSGLLFLCSSCFYQNLIILASVGRVVCLFFFLLAAIEWIRFLKERRLSSFLKTVFFQILAFLNFEDAMIFPLLALFLAWLIVPDPKDRKQILGRTIPLLVLADGVLAFFLLGTFSSSVQSTRWISNVTFDLIGGKLTSLVKMLIQPLLVPEKGFLPFTALPQNVVRLVPLLLFLFGVILFFSKRERLNFFLAGIWTRLTVIGAGWTVMAALPFLFHPLTFEHINRYLYFPMVGFSWILGVAFGRLFETARSDVSRDLASLGHLPVACNHGQVLLQMPPASPGHLPLSKKWMTLWAALIFYILGLNLTTTAYHYRRYVNYAREHKEAHSLERVRQIFRPAYPLTP